MSILQQSSILREERDVIARWTNCLIQEIETDRAPYDISRFGFPSNFQRLYCIFLILLLFFRRLLGKPLSKPFLTWSFGLILSLLFLESLREEWIWPSYQWWADTPSSTIPAHIMFFSLCYAARYCATLFLRCSLRETVTKKR